MPVQAALIRFRYAVLRAKQEGLWWTARESGRRAILWAGWLLLLPLTIPLHFAGFRRLPVLTGRIGHLAAEVDCFLKLERLGQIRQKRRRYFLLAPPQKVSNRCLLDYWRPFVNVISHPLVCGVAELMTRGPLMRHSVAKYVLAIGGAAQYFSVNAEWEGRQPILKLDRNHRATGERFLRELGLPAGAWYICVHAREGGYSPEDERVHDYRNVSIESLVPALQEVVRRGGWCIRMGDSSMRPMPKMERVIDYAHHPARSPEMDIFLCASCRFFLGNTSGLFIASSVFGVPSALTNMVPFASMGFSPRDLSMPKLIRSSRDARLLKASEILGSPVANYRMSGHYRETGLELIENSADEITDLVEEMLENLDGKATRGEAVDELQSRFRSLLHIDHYCYGSASNVSARFLARHRHIF